MSTSVASSSRLTSAPRIEPRRMLDRYEILAEIARGGMGTVYLARLGGAGGFERLFAIKLMHEHLAEDEQFVTMLLDEARTAAHIHHPNAVGIIDARESPVGYYLVMNYVDGFSFAQILEHPSLDPTTRVRIATRIIADAAMGLHGAHTAKDTRGEKLGIVHRDVSPQNILVGVDGVARIVDFGIALAASRMAASRPGVLKGKPSYMAPEQARGSACDARTDVFALGIILWESLTNEPLFEADMDLATIVKVMECVVDPPITKVPGLNEALSAVTMKALQKHPSDRYQSAREMAVALERTAEAAGLLAEPQEVEEVLNELFAHEIKARQDAIRGRVSAAQGPERTLDRVGLATIPRLIPRAMDEAANDEPSAQARQSGVRENAIDGGVDPIGQTSLHHTPAPGTAAPVRPPRGETTTRTRAAQSDGAIAAAPAPAPDRRPLVAALVLALVGIVSLGVAAAWTSGTSSGSASQDVDLPELAAPIEVRDEEVEARPEAAPAEPAAALGEGTAEASPVEAGAASAEQATAEPASAEPASAEPASAEQATVEASASEQATAEREAGTEEAEGPRSSEGSSRSRSRRARPQPAATPEAPPSPAAPPPPEPRRPTIEINPYLTH